MSWFIFKELYGEIFSNYYTLIFNNKDKKQVFHLLSRSSFEDFKKSSFEIWTLEGMGVGDDSTVFSMTDI